MLVSEKIKKAIESEVKSQNSFIKLIEAQEKNYGEDYSEKKEAIKKTLNFYEKILNEAA